ncbi:MAG: transglutaminase-like domain-containing protein [Candidatus Jordarchaeum sp.]|uniref:transglutaminase-like domain-containing protein n=1 Tax=Candidatus Jordarchaeum sp. TaxID=2823881 RepID=UPI00404AC3CB
MFEVGLISEIENVGGIKVSEGNLRWILFTESSHQKIDINKRILSKFRHMRMEEGNHYAYIKIGGLEPREKIVLRIGFRVITRDMRFKIPKFSAEDYVGSLIQEYCKPKGYWETRDKTIIALSEQLLSVSPSMLSLLVNIFKLVQERIGFREKRKDRLGAVAAFQMREGDCDELSDLFITLCRVCRIPARRVVGLVVNNRERFENHAWAEAYIPKAGWVPFDPALNLFAAISKKHIARCKMGKQSDYPSRKISWKTHKKFKKSPVKINETDVEYVKEIPP